MEETKLSLPLKFLHGGGNLFLIYINGISGINLPLVEFFSEINNLPTSIILNSGVLSFQAI